MHYSALKLTPASICSETASFGNMPQGTTVYGKMKVPLGAKSAGIDSISVAERHIYFFM